MRVPYFAYVHKVKPRVTWKWWGFRLRWFALDVQRLCDWHELAAGFKLEMCEPLTCDCCEKVRLGGPHRHSGFVSGDKPLHIRRWRFK